MIFNSYDENGRRVTINGCLSTRIQDEAILYNVRFKFKDKVAHLSDANLVNLYDDFSGSDMFGDDDERFLEFIAEVEG